MRREIDIDGLTWLYDNGWVTPMIEIRRQTRKLLGDPETDVVLCCPESYPADLPAPVWVFGMRVTGESSA